MNDIKLRMLLQQFYLEDIGEQDITSNAIFPKEKMGEGSFIVKEEGIIAGLTIIKTAYHLFDPGIQVEYRKKDGQPVKKGDVIAVVRGPVRYLLSGERVILNLIQRMSGVASLTNICVNTLNSNHTKICDTRKTVPGLRMLDKYAVTCGGGSNHRYGLYDGVMIKDNHIAFSGSITKAVEAAREHIGHMVKIEVETETEEQVIEAVQAKADVIMFDNRHPEEIEAFLKHVPDHIVTEASGGISLTNLAAYGRTGVDYVSLGMLTHSARTLDISLNVI